MEELKIITRFKEYKAAGIKNSRILLLAINPNALTLSEAIKISEIINLSVDGYFDIRFDSRYQSQK